MAKLENVDYGMLKKFYDELVKLNKDVTLDLFKKKSVLCSEYIENLKQPKGYIVIGDKIYSNDKEIGTFKVKQFYNNNSSSDVDIDSIHIAPRKSWFTKAKEKALDIVKKPADEDLQNKIKDIYYENYDLIKDLLNPNCVKYLTQEEIDSLRRFAKKYADNKDIFPSLFVSSKKAKQFLEELEYEKKEYLERFDKNSKIKVGLDNSIDELEQMELDFDKFEDKDKNKFRAVLKDIRDLERNISDKYFLDYEKLFNELDDYEKFLYEMENKYFTVTIIPEPEPLAGPPEPDPVVMTASTSIDEDDEKSKVETEAESEPATGIGLKDYIDKEKAVREKTNAFEEALKNAYKEFKKNNKESSSDELDKNESPSDSVLDLDNLNIIPTKAKCVPKTVVSVNSSEDLDEETNDVKIEEALKPVQEEPIIDIDLDSLNKRIYDTYSVSDINELNDEISSINSKINETSSRIDKKEKQILETEVALDLASQNSDLQKTKEYSEKLEKRRNKLEKLKKEQQDLETKKEEKESVISRFKEESIREYEQGEREKEEEFEKEEKSMEERLEKEAEEERDKNRKEITNFFKTATDDDLSPLMYKSKKEIQQYIKHIDKLKEEGKDPQEFIDKYDKLLREERKARENLKQLEDELNETDKKKKGKKK